MKRFMTIAILLTMLQIPVIAKASSSSSNTITMTEYQSIRGAKEVIGENNGEVVVVIDGVTYHIIMN